MGQRWWSRGAVVGSAAPVSELSSVEGAAAGGAAGEAVLLWGANTVCGRRCGGTPRRRAATWTTRMLASSLNVLQLLCQHYSLTFTSHSYSRWRHADQAAHLALSSVLSSIGGSVLFEGCPDDDMDLVWRGRVELIAVDGVLPDTSVKLRTKMQIFFPKTGHFYAEIYTMCIKMSWTSLKQRKVTVVICARVYLLSLPLGIAE